MIKEHTKSRKNETIKPSGTPSVILSGSPSEGGGVGAFLAVMALLNVKASLTRKSLKRLYSFVIVFAY